MTIPNLLLLLHSVKYSGHTDILTEVTSYRLTVSRSTKHPQQLQNTLERTHSMIYSHVAVDLGCSHLATFFKTEEDRIVVC